MIMAFRAYLAEVQIMGTVTLLFFLTNTRFFLPFFRPWKDKISLEKQI